MELRTLTRKVSSIGHAQYEHALLKASADATRIVHLLRSTSPLPALPLMDTLEDVPLEAVQALVSRSLTEHQVTQAFLPTRLSGLGAKNPRNIYLAARLSAIESYAAEFLPN